MVQGTPQHTRFEKARIIGARALQIAMGAPVVLADVSTVDPVLVAELEYKAKVIPITVVKRAGRIAPPKATPAKPERRTTRRREPAKTA